MQESSDCYYQEDKSSKLSNSRQQGGKSLIDCSHQLPVSSVSTSTSTNSYSSPLVSIITVVFNGERFIEKTINSVISQTYKNIEYIIIDGGSTDKTLDIIRQYEDRIDYWISEPDNGIYNAMNKGIKLSRGQLIGLINSDDWYVENAVETVVARYLANSDRANIIISGSIYRTDREENIIFRLSKPESFLHQKIDRIMPVNHPATFVDREVYKEIGLFDEQYKIAGDYDFIYRAYYSGKVKFIIVNDCLACMRLDGVSEKLASSLLRAQENFIIRSNQIHFIRNFFTFLHLFLWDISKKSIQKLLGKSSSSLYHKWRYK